MIIKAVQKLTAPVRKGPSVQAGREHRIVWVLYALDELGNSEVDTIFYTNLDKDLTNRGEMFYGYASLPDIPISVKELRKWQNRVRLPNLIIGGKFMMITDQNSRFNILHAKEV